MNKRTNKLVLSERSILREIVGYLKWLESAGKLYWIRNNSGAFVLESEKYRKRFVRFGRQGSSDLIVFLKGGRTIFFEVKRKNGYQTQAQKEFEQTIRALGYEYYVVRSLNEVILVISNSAVDNA